MRKLMFMGWITYLFGQLFGHAYAQYEANYSPHGIAMQRILAEIDKNEMPVLELSIRTNELALREHTLHSKNQ